jgi:hypothetical protein
MEMVIMVYIMLEFNEEGLKPCPNNKLGHLANDLDASDPTMTAKSLQISIKLRIRSLSRQVPA